MQPKAKENLLFLLGIGICFAIAALSVLLEELIPGGLLGASIIALFMGTIVNSFFHPKWIQPGRKVFSPRLFFNISQTSSKTFQNITPVQYPRKFNLKEVM